MLRHLEALLAFHDAGTVSAAAARLRVTQSAISKRIRALEETLGYRVLEPDGRRVRLTSRGALLLERAAPLVAELRSLGAALPDAGPMVLSLALSDSIASSWGPAVVRKAMQDVSGLQLELHAHRSVLVVEAVRLGRYQLGLCAETTGARDLVRDLIVEEPMVVVSSAADRATRNSRAVQGRRAVQGSRATRDSRDTARRPLITIEPGSATWRAVEPSLRRQAPQLLRRPRVTVESFAAALQMVRAGFGDGLVPLGVAREAGMETRSWHVVPEVSRRITLHSRKTVSLLPAVAALRESLARAARERLGEER
jgi:DNA-binding transcriptional LysR family regulator